LIGISPYSVQYTAPFKYTVTLDCSQAVITPNSVPTTYSYDLNTWATESINLDYSQNLALCLPISITATLVGGGVLDPTVFTIIAGTPYKL
jgi:hypothetical protein